MVQVNVNEVYDNLLHFDVKSSETVLPANLLWCFKSISCIYIGIQLNQIKCRWKSFTGLPFQTKPYKRTFYSFFCSFAKKKQKKTMSSSLYFTFFIDKKQEWTKNRKKKSFCHQKNHNKITKQNNNTFIVFSTHSMEWNGM